MDLDLEFSLAWQNNLLKAIDEGKTGKGVFTYCAKYHYDKNDMDNIVKNYIGDLHGFINFLNKNWGWIIKFSEDGKKIFVDENKDFCVCPVASTLKQTGNDIPKSLCNCSEQFARSMFSKVVGKEVHTKVIRPIIRDGKSCIYEIDL